MACCWASMGNTVENEGMILKDRKRILISKTVKKLYFLMKCEFFEIRCENKFYVIEKDNLDFQTVLAAVTLT